MNILRQYSLPNCTLILEGFDDGTGTTQTLTILSNVECRFANSRQVLNGGKVFFDHLVKSVSDYAQGLLSGIHHPPDHGSEDGQLFIENVQPANIHRLTWQTGGAESTNGTSNTVNLSTAELFDLTEAIDQFLADNLTLPNFILPLHPLSRRYSIPEESLAERVTPPLIGVSGFALAAFALFFVPAPEPRQGEGDTSNANETTEQPSDGDTTGEAPQAIPEGALVAEDDLETLLNAVPEIEDNLSLRMIQTYLYQTLDQAWTERPDSQVAAYRLSVAADGSIVGYQPIEGTTTELAENTPLPQLTYSSVDEAIANKEPVAQFKVVFDKKVLEVSPWKGFQGDGEVSFDSSTLRGDALRQLVVDTRRKIATALGNNAVATNEPLRYTIAVTDAGAIAFYIPESAAANQSVNATPLPELIEPEAAGIVPGQSVIPQEPLTQINLVFRPNGVVEVSPWAGYR